MGTLVGHDEPAALVVFKAAPTDDMSRYFTLTNLLSIADIT
jgi:hypothetical protein